MNQFLKYKGYLGSIEVSIEYNCLHGKVQFIEDAITYEGKTPEELERIFSECIEDYITTCKEIGREPQKAFSGSFNVRVGKELHKKAAIQSRIEGISLNEIVKDAIENRTSNDSNITVHHHHEVTHVLRAEGTYTESADIGENIWQQNKPALLAQH